MGSNDSVQLSLMYLHNSLCKNLDSGKLSRVGGGEERSLKVKEEDKVFY